MQRVWQEAFSGNRADIMDEYAQYLKVKTSTVYWPGDKGVPASDLDIAPQEVNSDELFK